MGKAKVLGEFMNAMAMMQFAPQNTMYGDVCGNIFYPRAGRAPIHPDGYDWTRPVPGNTSKTELLKPTWYQKEELMKNLGSKKELRLP